MKQPVRVSLCPACGACPKVVIAIAKDEVRIGEEGNLVPLTAEYTGHPSIAKWADAGYELLIL